LNPNVQAGGPLLMPALPQTEPNLQATADRVCPPKALTAVCHQEAQRPPIPSLDPTCPPGPRLARASGMKFAPSQTILSPWTVRAALPSPSPTSAANAQSLARGGITDAWLPH